MVLVMVANGSSGILLRPAARAFGPKEVTARARCVTAEAEIALVSRDLVWPLKPLALARQALEGPATRPTQCTCGTWKSSGYCAIGAICR